MPIRTGCMKKNFKYLALFVFLFCLSDQTKGSQDNEKNPPSTDPGASRAVRVFERNFHGFQLFRIPALVKTNRNTLLVFAEARKLSSNGDKGDIDLVLRRSTDGGKTWGDMITVWNDGENTCGNPVPVIDKESGDIHLVATWNNQRVFVLKSTDDGLTWTTPKEITSSVKPAGWGFYATGPVHGIQISEGRYKGRLVIPSYARVLKDGGLKNHSFIIYSDDRGESWKIGDVTSEEGVEECTVVELKGGRLMLSMRSHHPYRTVAMSDNGGVTWSKTRPDTVLIDPLCQGSLLSAKAGTGNALFFSNPASNKRENVTIRLSADEGNTWPKSHRVFAGPSAYSDMVMLDKNTIGIIFESGIKSPHGHILFDTVSVSDIK